jgi:hypothetical protein
MRGRVQWKNPTEYTDEDRRRAVTCPCLLGIQDSTHFLVCSHRRIVELRRNVISVSTTIVHAVLEQHLGAEGSKGRSGKRRKRSPHSDPVVTPLDTHRHLTELSAWDSITEERKLLLTLGMSNTYINTQVRRRLVTECLPMWATIEHLWNVVNVV